MKAHRNFACFRRFMQTLKVSLHAFSIFLLLYAISITALAAGTDTERFGYTCLENENQRKTYRALQEMVADYDTHKNVSLKMSKADIQFALEMFYADFPEYFWFKNNLHCQGKGNRITELETVYIAGDIAKQRAEMDQIVNEILDEMPHWINSDQEIARYLHDVVAQRITYKDTPNDQTPYGGLVEGYAVCGGYARTYQMLLNAAGIDAWYVNGMAYYSDGREPGNHAWNLVWLDGVCVYTDVCWDDNDGVDTVDYEYFNISLEQMSLDHLPQEDTQKILPACNHTEWSLLPDMSQITLEVDDSVTGADLIEHLQIVRSEDYGYATVTFRYTGSNFQNWYQKNRRELFDSLAWWNGWTHWQNIGSVYQLQYATGAGGCYDVLDSDTVRIEMNYLGAEFTPYGAHTLMVAYYDADGQMIQMSQTSVQLNRGQIEFWAEAPSDFAQCRVFTLDPDTMIPQCAASLLVPVC